MGWPQRLAQTYIMELRELIRLDSVAAQLLKHCRSPPLCEGPRGPMVSYFGTLKVFTARLRSSLLAGVASMLWTCLNESMSSVERLEMRVKVGNAGATHRE